MEREFCTNPIDFITRRTRLAFLDRKISDEILPHICDIMAKQKGFNAEETANYYENNKQIFEKMEF